MKVKYLELSFNDRVISMYNKQIMTSDKEMYTRNAQIYKILANPIRLELLNKLNIEQELTVNQLAELLGIRKANVSQHLAVLRSHNLVIVRRSGQNAYYSVYDEKIVAPCKIFRSIWDK